MTLQRIERVTVENWRNWREPPPVEGLGPGLVVLSGPNAVGKTGLWEAIALGLLDRHWGAHTDRLRPAGTKRVIPRVEIDFVADDLRYRIEKHFGGADQRDKASFWAETNGEWHLEDQGEEAYLRCRRAVIGEEADAPNRGGTKLAFKNTLMEVLLPEQGTLVEPKPTPDAVSMAVTDRDAAADATRLGRVSDLVKRQANAQWVENRNRPRKGTELFAGEERLERLDEEIVPLQEKAERIRDLVARLTAATEELEGLGDASERVQRAEELRREARDHRVRREQAEALHAEAKRASDAAEQAHAARQESIARRATRTEEWEAARRRQAEAKAAHERAEREFEAATEGREARTAGEHQYRTWIEYESRGADLENLRRVLVAATERLDRVRKGEAEARAARAERASLVLPTEEELAELGRLERECFQAAGRLEAGAWAVEGRPPPGVRLRVDGQEEEGDPVVSAKASHEVTLSASGGETLRMSAPPEDAGEVERTRRALTDALGRFDADALPALRERITYVTTRLDERIARAEQSIADALGDVDANELLKDQIRLEQQVGDKEAMETPTVPRPDGAVAKWAPTLDVLRGELKKAHQRVEDARGEMEAALTAERTFTRESQQAETAAGQARAVLDAHREEHGDDEDLLRAAIEAAEQSARLHRAWKPLDDAKAMAEDAREKRADQLAAGLAAAVAKQEEIRELETRIDEWRTEDPESRLAALEAERADLVLRVGRARVHAEALLVLERALEAGRDELTAAVGEPISERVGRWASYLLQDESRVTVGEDGRPAAVTTPAGQAVPFAEQSFGTREQLSVLYRLAVADLVAEDTGSGVCLMLDDPFGHTDRGRRARLLEILEAEAARREHQILLFTCRPEDFEGVGQHVPVGVGG